MSNKILDCLTEILVNTKYVKAKQAGTIGNNNNIELPTNLQNKYSSRNTYKKGEICKVLYEGTGYFIILKDNLWTLQVDKVHFELVEPVKPVKPIQGGGRIHNTPRKPRTMKKKRTHISIY